MISYNCIVKMFACKNWSQGVFSMSHHTASEWGSSTGFLEELGSEALAVLHSRLHTAFSLQSTLHM